MPSNRTGAGRIPRTTPRTQTGFLFLASSFWLRDVAGCCVQDAVLRRRALGARLARMGFRGETGKRTAIRGAAAGALTLITPLLAAGPGKRELPFANG